ncbi:hypothetical protein [Mucilaginibacter antarcticus]|uniref:Uncharacterized protein n=1 Tax=Mucilaginibacter antarcticus TaxID=1855725 RepID=A0ABW5XV30_9SPHI
MVISKKQQYKVILLLAGYLFIVLNHLYFIEPPQKIAADSTYYSANLVPNGYDKFGRNIIAVKKIFKSVVNRDADDQQGKALHELYVAELLYDASLPTLTGSKLYTSTTPITKLPVKRFYNLRI